jgi:parvulin-like peptidyl-prolyl isomerase
LLLVLALGACSRGGAAKGGEAGDGGALVARVGHAEIREADIERAMARDPGASPARFEAPEARRALVDGIVRFELLAQGAEEAGLTKDPDAIHAQRQIAVTKFVNRELGAAGSPEGVSQADVEREYAARKDTEFTRPEAVHIRHVRVADAEKAARAAAKARALPRGDDAAFAALATAISEDLRTRESGGDLGFIDKSSRLARPLVDAALALRAPGDVAGPIATSEGYEIVRLVERRSAATSPLAAVEEQIRQRLYRERRTKALEDLIARLRAKTPVEVADAPIAVGHRP